MNKNVIKETMLSLEAGELQSAREEYQDYLAEAKLDGSETIDNDEAAQADIARHLSEVFDDQIHEHSDKLDRLRKVDFGPKQVVEEGSVVRFGGRLFVIAVSTNRFSCEGQELIGLSTEAPIYNSIAGLSSGEHFRFHGKKILIEEVF